MKKNLSEEFVETDDRLVFKPENDVILCDLEGKEIEKVNKETVKDLKDKIKMVDKEINKAEAKKIKYLESKLHLEEPSDVLVEDVLDEAPIPGDLAKAYRGASYKGGNRVSNTDLQKATYTKLTPEEALDIAKKDKSKLLDMRLLMDGKLVKLRDTGYGDTDYHFRNQWLPKEKSYVRRNGDLLRDSSGIHYKNLFNLADAIYITNETAPEAQKDPDLLAARAENPESPRYDTYKHSLDDIAADNSRGEYWGYSNQDIKYLSRRVKEYGKEVDEYRGKLKDLEKRHQEGSVNEDDYKYYKDRYLRNIKDNLNNQQYYQDKITRKKYTDSEVNLRGPIKDFKDIKKELRRTESDINDLTDKENKIKTSGSQDTRYAKEQLDYYNSRLEEILKEISKYEIRIEDAPQKDAEKLKEVQDLKAETLKKQQELQDKKAELFNKIKKESLLYQQIEQQNLVEEFEDLMDTIYPKGYDIVNICEALEEQQELITESLELEVNDEE